MKKISKVSTLAAFLAFAAPFAASAQDPLAGFIFVNATGEPAPLHLDASGKKLFLDEGLASGMATSGLGLPAGRHVLTAKVEGCVPGEKALDLAVGKCPTLVAFIREVKDKESGKMEKRISFLELPHKPAPADAYLLRLLYVPKSLKEDGAPSSLAGSIGGKEVVLKPLQPLEVEAGKKAAFKTQDGRALETTDLEEPGAYYYIIYDSAEGGLQSVVSQDKLYVWD